MAQTRLVPPETASDPLGEALHSLHMSGVFYSRCEFSEPWGLELPPLEDYLMFHVVTSGGAWLVVDGAEPQLLQPGDLGLVPHGRGHKLLSEPGEPSEHLFDIEREQVSDSYEIIRLGGGGPGARIICGVVRFENPAARQLMELLPRVIYVEATSSPEMEWIQSTLRLMAFEARDIRPGGETVITRLADILVIQAIRSWIAEDPAAQTGWLGALRDPQIGRAISLMHRDPGRQWSLMSLASEVAMSRSAFAARFTELVGEPPMQYLARWRMHVALTALSEDDAPLGDLARRIGYRSEAAFSRAFKRFLGVSPGAARRAIPRPAVGMTP
ncbi:MAG TPA: AraC family transcriptional regulator [Dehalococcoidia bacterium]|nr:AraC family transcriptional regulator [Dehalococcoidia bacterium]